MTISFYGAAQRVTGSNYLVDTGKYKFLVDCGLFQGDKNADKENWNEFKFNPKEIDFLLITHSHIDHIGRIPLLYKNGFRGKIFSSKPTKEFCQIFLEDSCHHLEDLATELNLPNLYSKDDIDQTMKLFETYDYYQEFQPKEGINIKFYDAGHILGSAVIEIKTNGKTIIFSGDLGNPPVPILKDTDFVPNADYLVLESTYGDRNHEPSENRSVRLERVVEETIKNKGTLLIPAFAMERTQEILYDLNELIENGKISKLPIYVDSPLALKSTKIYQQFPEYFDHEAKQLLKEGINFFDFPSLKFAENTEESKELDNLPGPKIIIAGSGMSTGGKILFHEKRYLSDPTTTLLIIGYQVKGTLGRELQEGAKNVNILSDDIAVIAKVETIESYSAHADQQRLQYWISKINKPIKKIFLVHGEPEIQDVLLHKIEDEEGMDVCIPKNEETIELK